MIRRTCAPLVVLFAMGVASLAESGEILRLVLIDAESDREIGVLADGYTLDLAEDGGQLNVRADVEGEVGSVRFALDDHENFRTESVRPFALAGDTEGDYHAWRPQRGKHRITATPYAGPGASGQAGQPLSIQITVEGEPKPRAVQSEYDDIQNDEQMGVIPPPIGGKASVSGRLVRWHAVTLSFEGPKASETGRPNPFLHYRLDVTFRQGDRELVVPGYFAGDGNGGDSGRVWRAHFTPPTTGVWQYKASFRAGYQVNVADDPKAGTPTAMHGAAGAMTIAESRASGDDFRAPNRGLLINRGTHYLTFPTGEPWLKGGPDIPENFLGYDGFDNTPNAGHQFAAHAGDWKPGDPDWGDHQGRRIIGALNAIAELGGNCIYFLPMNVGGDGKDTYPTIAPYEKVRYDNSKMDQWEIVFTHAQSLGIFLHFQLAETESGNENYHDDGQLGPERKLFYRQMIARFAHHSGMQWNLGEENDYGTQRRIDFANFIRAVDPYDHAIASHTHGGKAEESYDPILDVLAAGEPVAIDMASFQDGRSSERLAELFIRFREKTAKLGAPWVLSLDEPQPIHNDLDDQERGYAHGRRHKMWPAYMSGGGGFEWYVQMDGGGHAFDHKIENFRDMGPALEWTAIARELLLQHPLLEMAPRHELGRAAKGHTLVLAKPGDVYVVYNDACGKDFELNLSDAEGTYDIAWCNPREGGPLTKGSVEQVEGGAWRGLGRAPESADDDWACVVTRRR